MTWILAHFWLMFAAVCVAATVAVLGVVVLVGRKYTGCTRWPLPCTCQDDEWDEGWRREPETVEDAAAMTAEWHTDLPGPDPLRSLRPVNGDPGETAGSLRVGELHRDVWAQLRDDPALIEWNLARHIEALRQHEIGARSDVSRIREIRGELANLRKELCAA